MSRKKGIILLLVWPMLVLAACGLYTNDSKNGAVDAIPDPPVVDREDPTATALNADNEAENPTSEQAGEETMQIKLKCNGNTIVFELNDSQAAKDLYHQLPMSIEVQDYGSNEKIFYPPQALDANGAPEASGNVGCLAYYAPWDNVVMFYKPFQPSPGGRLYELGQAVSGSEHIQNLAGVLNLSME